MESFLAPHDKHPCRALSTHAQPARTRERTFQRPRGKILSCAHTTDKRNSESGATQATRLRCTRDAKTYPHPCLPKCTPRMVCRKQIDSSPPPPIVRARCCCKWFHGLCVTVTYRRVPSWKSQFFRLPRLPILTYAGFHAYVWYQTNHPANVAGIGIIEPPCGR